MVWPWLLSPLPQQPNFAPVLGAKGRFSKNDRDQGQTRKQETVAGHVAN
jgi:hypothetical protein